MMHCGRYSTVREVAQMGRIVHCWGFAMLCFDAVIHSAALERGGCRIWLAPRETGGRMVVGSLLIVNWPSGVTPYGLVGTELWGEKGEVMVGLSRWGECLGKGKLFLVRRR